MLTQSKGQTPPEGASTLEPLTKQLPSWSVEMDQVSPDLQSREMSRATPFAVNNSISPGLTQLPGAEIPRAGAGVSLSTTGALTINPVLNPTGFTLPRLKTPLRSRHKGGSTGWIRKSL